MLAITRRIAAVNRVANRNANISPRRMPVRKQGRLKNGRDHGIWGEWHLVTPEAEG